MESGLEVMGRSSHWRIPVLFNSEKTLQKSNNLYSFQGSAQVLVLNSFVFLLLDHVLKDGQCFGLSLCTQTLQWKQSLIRQARVRKASYKILPGQAGI